MCSQKRLSKYPGRAKTLAESAVNHPMGVITDNGGNYTVKNDVDHPMNTINNAWNDIRMGAPMESILTGYNDPRIGMFFRPSVVVDGVYKGIRQGIAIADKGDYIGFSALQDLGNVQLMVAAEVYFLRVELPQFLYMARRPAKSTLSQTFAFMFRRSRVV